MQSSRSDPADVYVARQPIFDRKQQVVGYELLFREGTTNATSVLDHEAATASVVLNALTEIGLRRIVGARGAWVKVPRESIAHGIVDLLPKRAIVEILKRETIDDALIDAVAQLRRNGRTVALDHFRYTPQAEPLLRLAEYVKLDLVELGREGFSAEVAACRRFGVKIVAARVENRRDHAFCRAAGCELFQGYFFCRPEIMQSRRIDTSRAAVVDLLATLQDPAVELADLQSSISLDVGLSVRLLRYINSAFFGLRQPVRSITQALALLGVEHLKRWAALTMFASIEGKPLELTVTALVRARFCELTGDGGTEAGELFTLGLLSVIDALLDEPIEEALTGLPIARDLRDALVRHAGPRGHLLECVLALEAGDFARAQELHPAAGSLYTAAIAWANELAEPLFERPVAQGWRARIRFSPLRRRPRPRRLPATGRSPDPRARARRRAPPRCARPAAALAWPRADRRHQTPAASRASCKSRSQAARRARTAGCRWSSADPAQPAP